MQREKSEKQTKPETDHEETFFLSRTLSPQTPETTSLFKSLELETSFCIYLRYLNQCLLTIQEASCFAILSQERNYSITSVTSFYHVIHKRKLHRSRGYHIRIKQWDQSF